MPGQPGFNPQSPGQQTFPFPTSTGTGTGNLPTPNMSGPPMQGQPMQGQAQGGAAAAQNPALGMINNMLTNPQQGAAGAANNNSMGAGGLAGVATTFKGASIKVYKDHQKYQEWEFIFDLKQGLPGQPQTGQQQQNTQGGPNTTQTPAPRSKRSADPAQATRRRRIVRIRIPTRIRINNSIVV